MAIVRAVLMAVLMLAIISLPAWVGVGSPLLRASTASAAAAASPLSDDNDNDDGNWNDNGNGNGNSNRNDNDDNENGNNNDNKDDHTPYRPSPPAPPTLLPPGVVARCYAAGEAGALSLMLDGGSVTLDVVSTSSFPRSSKATLAKVDPASVPGAPGPVLGGIVFELRAQEGCDGTSLAELPADANLGVAYGVPATPAKLRFARLDGGRWVDVPTVPDPNPSNPYVSATVRRTGTYVLYQTP